MACLYERAGRLTTKKWRNPARAGYLKTSCAGVAGDTAATSGVLNASDWPPYAGGDRGGEQGSSFPVE